MDHVSLITLGVSDLDRATRFYEQLGWKRSSASVEGTVAFLRGGSVVIGLFGRDDLAEEAGVDLPPPGASAAVALAANLESEQAVDAAMTAAAAAGGRITKPATRQDWGGYSGYVADPDGHLWEVAHNPGFRLLPDGQVRLPDEA
jgi:catechol 2,3-dioxygenase-like lactoylglutathione lyase family enzyme